MKQKIYSYILVASQYTAMIILIIINKSAFLQVVPLALFCIGFFIGIYAIYCNKPDNFNITPDIKKDSCLINHGIYRHIRHPMYFSVALMMLGMIIYNLNLLNMSLYTLLILSIFLKARKEEILWCQKSDEYEKYREKTKAFIPFIL